MKSAFHLHIRKKIEGERGVTIVLVAILMFIFLGITALVIDGAHLMVVRNELQNAADAGALAGARFLYNEYGTEINTGANQIAYDAATQNKALAKTGGAIAVDVNFGDGQNLDVQRGHWKFSTHTFTPSDSLNVIDLERVTTEELDNMDGSDGNPPFINAVRVIARRQATPAASFFARLFGYADFELSADAVAYIGYSGTLIPGEAEQPIAICQQSISAEDTSYDCNIGRMLNSGSNPSDHNTAGWTNFRRCGSTTFIDDVKKLLETCSGNPYEINLGGSIGTTGGVADIIITYLKRCWKDGRYDSNGDGVKESSIDTDGDGIPDMPWNLTLVVIDCPSNNVLSCSKTVGAVNVNVVWILEKENNIDADAPYRMGAWSNSSTSGEVRWNDFVSHFNLLTPDGYLATVANGGFKMKSVYFLPDCAPHELKGGSGGENFGVLAKIPVLVK